MNQNGSDSVFERHAQTALTLLVVALLSWVVFTTQQTAVDVARLIAKIESLESEIAQYRRNSHNHRGG